MKERHALKGNVGTVLMVLVVVVSFLFSSAALAGDIPKDVNVITPAPGASVHMIAVGVGQSVQKHTPVDNWIVQPLGGPKLWLPMMSQGKTDFSTSSPWSTTWVLII